MAATVPESKVYSKLWFCCHSSGWIPGDLGPVGHMEVTGQGSSISSRTSRRFVAADGFAAIRADGAVVTWGMASFGGDSSSVQDQLRNVRHIFGALPALAAILQDETVVTWGLPLHGGASTKVPAQLKNFHQIASIHDAFAAIVADGRLSEMWRWQFQSPRSTPRGAADSRHGLCFCRVEGRWKNVDLGQPAQWQWQLQSPKAAWGCPAHPMRPSCGKPGKNFRLVWGFKRMMPRCKWFLGQLTSNQDCSRLDSLRIRSLTLHGSWGSTSLRAWKQLIDPQRKPESKKHMLDLSALVCCQFLQMLKLPWLVLWPFPKLCGACGSRRFRPNLYQRASKEFQGASMSHVPLTCFSCLPGTVWIPILLQVLVPTSIWLTLCGIIPEHGQTPHPEARGSALSVSGCSAYNGRSRAHGHGSIQKSTFALIGINPLVTLVWILSKKNITPWGRLGEDSSLHFSCPVAAAMPLRCKIVFTMNHVSLVPARSSDLATRTAEPAWLAQLFLMPVLTKLRIQTILQRRAPGAQPVMCPPGITLRGNALLLETRVALCHKILCKEYLAGRLAKTTRLMHPFLNTWATFGSECLIADIAATKDLFFRVMVSTWPITFQNKFLL